MKIKVIVDANVIIYYLIGYDITDNAIQKLFEQQDRYQFVTTTRILDEVIFKLMVIKSGKRLKQLKKDHVAMKQQTVIIDTVKKFIKDYQFKVYEIELKHYWRLPLIMEEYGLIGNDALTMAIARENNLKYIATIDADFNRTQLHNILD